MRDLRIDIDQGGDVVQRIEKEVWRQLLLEEREIRLQVEVFLKPLQIGIAGVDASKPDKDIERADDNADGEKHKQQDKVVYGRSLPEDRFVKRSVLFQDPIDKKIVNGERFQREEKIYQHEEGKALLEEKSRNEDNLIEKESQQEVGDDREGGDVLFIRKILEIHSCRGGDIPQGEKEENHHDAQKERRRGALSAKPIRNASEWPGERVEMFEIA